MWHSFCQDEKLWPLMPPLPSYGYGREHKGPRYGSLIHGQNLRDVVLTGKYSSWLIIFNSIIHLFGFIPLLLTDNQKRRALLNIAIYRPEEITLFSQNCITVFLSPM